MIFLSRINRHIGSPPFLKTFISVIFVCKVSYIHMQSKIYLPPTLPLFIKALNGKNVK